ncbi:putative selenate ABC transporter substrate-binding protein [Oceanicoccus sp. KOV_DT_Chl]|uniref:putative selenate ABC transporter substrate-binding protein n=1 Tax=Oceanicoccus sp. KOV_DT_Chl TaxID=1904639 RepID=UPI001F324FEC|nr:putative selenate ABC transporter substrate-binding protein [Oceanicoccus sp. KOV_DT_Chl]
MKIIIALLLSFITLSATAQPLVFTAIPDADETRLKARFTQVADYLAKELGIEVQYIPVKSYAAAVTAFRNNQVQLAWFGGLSGVQARLLSPGAEAIAQGEEDQHFKSYFIAHSSTGLKSGEVLPAAIKDMSFTFGSKSSTSGRLMPEYFIRQQFKKSPEQLFDRVGFSGNHSRTIALVQSGSYQLGALNYQVWEQELSEGKIDLEKVSIIWTTPEYADYQWTVRGDVEKHWGQASKKN